MNWEKIVKLIPEVIEKVRKGYVLNNMIIKDDIFGIWEKHCTVLYYPIIAQEIITIKYLEKIDKKITNIGCGVCPMSLS